MSELEAVIYNLSFKQYKHITIYPTALSQLDHIFSVIGNGYTYDPVKGPWYDHDEYQDFLTTESVYDFDAVKEQHTKYLKEDEHHYNSLREVFAEIPERFVKLYEKSVAMYTQPFSVKPESYYFDPESIANEHIRYVAEVVAEGHRMVATPYPLCNYSLCFEVKSNDNPVIVKLVLSTYKAWLKVLDYNLNNGLYLSEDEVEELGGTAFYHSDVYMRECQETIQTIIDDLES